MASTDVAAVAGTGTALAVCLGRDRSKDGPCPIAPPLVAGVVAGAGTALALTLADRPFRQPTVTEWLVVSVPFAWLFGQGLGGVLRLAADRERNTDAASITAEWQSPP